MKSEEKDTPSGNGHGAAAIGITAAIASGAIAAYLLSKKTNRTKVKSALKLVPRTGEDLLDLARGKSAQIRELVDKVDDILRGDEAVVIREIKKKINRKNLPRPRK